MSQRELPTWLIGSAVAVFLVVVVGLWYRYLGPGSVPPPPTRVEAQDIGGYSPKAWAAWNEQRRGR